MKKSLDNERLVALLKGYMLRHHLNQEEMAKKLGVTGVTIGHWINGENGITRRNAASIENLCVDGHIITQTGAGSAASIHGNATAAPVTVSGENDIAKMLDNLRDRILNDDDICDKCKVRVMKHISSSR